MNGVKYLGPRGANLIKSFETLQLKAYKPTPNDVWTIGYGSTRDVKPGMIITLAEAEDRFMQDASSTIREVNNRFSKTLLTQAMFDALVSLVFNVGASAISPTSTIGSSLIVKDYYSAWAGFALWRKQRGPNGLQNLLGLARRRAKEMSLFLEDGMP